MSVILVSGELLKSFDKNKELIFHTDLGCKDEKGLKEMCEDSWRWQQYINSVNS